MDIAIYIFEKLTALDAIGPYEVLQRLPGANVKFVGPERGPVRTDQGMLGVVVDYERDEVMTADILVVPGGIGTRALITDEPTLEWIRAIDAGTTWTTSVCTGSLLLGAAGLLEGKQATTHWAALDMLAQFGATPTSERVVGHRHGAPPRRARRRRRRRAGDPTRYRVRPPAPLRHRLGRQGTGADPQPHLHRARRRGHQRPRVMRTGVTSPRMARPSHAGTRVTW